MDFSEDYQINDGWGNCAGCGVLISDTRLHCRHCNPNDWDTKRLVELYKEAG